MDYRKKIVKECVNQNKLLKQKKLTIQTFSNVSIRLNDNYFTIKPSGVSPEKIIPPPAGNLPVKTLMPISLSLMTNSLRKPIKKENSPPQ